MQACQSRSLISRIVVFVTLVSVFAGAAFASGPTEKVLHLFNEVPDGMDLEGAVVADAAGNLYGLAAGGGLSGGGTPCCGVVFELSPPTSSGGTWTETVLHEFGSGDGAYPFGTLIFDKLGNLYGTTSGTVFELKPPATSGGAWIEIILCDDCNFAAGKLVFDGAGNLYGISRGQYNSLDGAVFELERPASSGGTWTHKTIYTFGSFSGDGYDIWGSVVLRGGALYGTTRLGGAADSGTVFKLTQIGGVWTETILHSFDPTKGEGATPLAGVIFDTAGNIYGTTTLGGSSNLCGGGCGTVYELSPPAFEDGHWQENTLYNFSGADGANPEGELNRDKANNLYGTTTAGGPGASRGTVFKLKPPLVAGGAWTEVVLHGFGGVANADGAAPVSSMIERNGLLYGTTSQGGLAFRDRTGGVVFSVVP